ncbi:hypothetical protein TNCV_173091 [Trichonephila clavipes]|nr:hypothetical protein TNCV_173091 [Trichonephila clavipes]
MASGHSSPQVNLSVQGGTQEGYHKFKKSAAKTFQILTEAYGDEILSSAHVFERAWVRIPEKTWMFVSVHVPLRHEDTLNSRRVASPLERMVAGDTLLSDGEIPHGVGKCSHAGLLVIRVTSCELEQRDPGTVKYLQLSQSKRELLGIDMAILVVLKEFLVVGPCCGWQSGECPTAVLDITRLVSTDHRSSSQKRNTSLKTDSSS